VSNTASRLITLIFLLKNRPNQKAGELASKLGVSLRTIHRYFAMLDEMGIPVYAKHGPYGGFSLVRGYKIPPLVSHSKKQLPSIWGQVWSAKCGDSFIVSLRREPWQSWRIFSQTNSVQR
jgi:DNA binding protein with HTH domain